MLYVNKDDNVIGGRVGKNHDFFRINRLNRIVSIKSDFFD